MLRFYFVFDRIVFIESPLLTATLHHPVVIDSTDVVRHRHAAGRCRPHGQRHEAREGPERNIR